MMNRLKMNVSSAILILSLIYVLSFLLGCYIGSIDYSHESSIAQATLLVSIVLALIPIIATLVNLVIKEEARKLSQDVIENKNERIEFLESIQHRELLLVKRIKDFIDEAQRSKSDENLKSTQEDLMRYIVSLEIEERAACEIVSWLAIRENKILLMNYSVKIAMSLNSFTYEEHKESIKLFKKDIFCCIEWIHDSLLQGVPYRVRTAALARSASSIPGGLANHIAAIRAIEKHPSIQERADASKNLHSLTDILIVSLEEELQINNESIWLK